MAEGSGTSATWGGHSCPQCFLASMGQGAGSCLWIPAIVSRACKHTGAKSLLLPASNPPKSPPLHRRQFGEENLLVGSSCGRLFSFLQPGSRASPVYTDVYTAADLTECPTSIHSPMLPYGAHIYQWWWQQTISLNSFAIFVLTQPPLRHWAGLVDLFFQCHI